MIEFYIMNDFDRPCLDLTVAKIGKYGKYLSGHDGKFTDFSEATKLEDFGIVIKDDEDFFYFIKEKESVAKYRDGRNREWQGGKRGLYGKEVLQKLFKTKEEEEIMKNIEQITYEDVQDWCGDYAGDKIVWRLQEILSGQYPLEKARVDILKMLNNKEKMLNNKHD